MIGPLRFFLYLLWTFYCIPTYQIQLKLWSENTNLPHCTADLQFDWLGFSWFDCVELDRDLQVWLNPNQSNRRSAVQWYFPFQSKWVFSAVIYLAWFVKNEANVTRQLVTTPFSWLIRCPGLKVVRRGPSRKLKN